MAYIMSFDQGTTSSRAVIFDDKGQVVAIAQKEFEQHFPKPGLVEHDAMEIWATQMGVAQEVLTKANLKSTDIAAIGITNQRETVVVWEKATGRPIHRAIVWQDRRTSAYTTSLKEKGHEAMITKKTGLVADPYFSGTKIKWILDNVEGAREKAKRGELLCGTIDTWLIWKLTEGASHVTDVSNASRTLLLNIHTASWDDELLALFDIPKSMLPTVVSSSVVVGHAQKDAFQGASVPIAGIAGDQQAATFGQACYDVGMAKNTYGTGCFMLMNVGDTPVPSQNKLLSTILWKTDNGLRYALEGSVFVGGAVVQWLRDGLRIIHKSSEVEDLSNKVEDNGGVYFVPAFTGLGTPHWDPYARGAILGITRGTTAGHIARAALESIAYQSSEVLVAMQKDAHTPLTQLRVDGGATQNDFLMQFQTDLLRVPVVRAKVQETTALGACYLAGLAIGLWKNEKEINALWQADKEFTPKMSVDHSDFLKDNWTRAVTRSLDWAREV